MRLKNISLITLIAFGTYANAITLQEALVGGKTTGEIRSLTYYSSKTDAINSKPLSAPLPERETSGIALQLNYKTADFYGFNAEVGFQAGHDLQIGSTSETEPRVAVSGTNLYLMNLGYNRGLTSIKVGRQLISTPLIAGSNVHPLRDSFQAISIINKDLPNTEIGLYAINEWYQRYTAESGNSAATHFTSPVYSIHIKNDSIKGLALEGQYMTTNHTGNNGDKPISVNGGYSNYFASFNYKLPIEFPLSFGAFKAGTSYDNASDANFYGVKIGTKIANTVVKLAYTSVSDSNNFTGALGHVPNYFKYNGGQMYTDNFYAGTDATSILLIPDFGVKGLKTLFSYSKYSQSDEGIINSGSLTSTYNYDGVSEIQVDLRYSFDGSFKGLSTRLQTALIDYDIPGDSKMYVTRLYLNYKF